MSAALLQIPNFRNVPPEFYGYIKGTTNADTYVHSCGFGGGARQDLVEK